MRVSDQLAEPPFPKGKCTVVLDIDNTLTPPRRPLEADMARALRGIKIPFFLSAGGDLRLAYEQFIEPLHGFGFRGAFDAFLCNGSTRYQCELFEQPSVKLIRDFEIRDYLGEERFKRFLRVVETALNMDEFRLSAPIRVIGERIVDRVSMINVAPIGRPRERLTDEMHANRQAFKQYDERTGFRMRFLAHLRRELADFSAVGMHISLGGETSFDVVINGNDKSFPLRSLLQEGYERIWYVGDALFEGGNDEAVLKFIEQWPGTHACPVEAIPVSTWHDTVGVLNDLGILDSVTE
jgi:hypothetical protein